MKKLCFTYFEFIRNLEAELGIPNCFLANYYFYLRAFGF